MSSIPSLGLGTFRLKGQQVIDSVSTGLELGYRHIDTAQFYGNETEVGQAIAQSGIPRDQLFVTTKVWIDNLDSDRLQASIEESLEKLALDQLDLTLIHWPSPNDDIPVADYMKALLRAKERGLTKLIGVSNFTIAHMKDTVAAIGQENLATNQIEIHPFLQNRKLAAFAKEQGVHLTAYMPLAYGKVIDEPLLQRIAAKYDVTPAQVSLAWLLQQGYAVIPSSTKREHLQANLAARDLRLSAEDMAAIAELDRGDRIAKPDFAPQWD